MNWELVTVGPMEWQQDDSGVYTVIHNVPVGVRLDVMRVSDNEPIKSFQGSAHDVRILAVRWMKQHCPRLSTEHASYIGTELARAAMLGRSYVQD